jgi:DNA-binding response OmpR family regulator
LLREYLSKQNYRVLMLSDVQRGLTRMRNNPTDCLVLMAESQDEGLAEGFQELLHWKRTSSIPVLVVLSQKQSEWRTLLEGAGRTRVLTQPVQLRDLRTELETLLGKP